MKIFYIKKKCNKITNMNMDKIFIVNSFNNKNKLLIGKERNLSHKLKIIKENSKNIKYNNFLKFKSKKTKLKLTTPHHLNSKNNDLNNNNKPKFNSENKSLPMKSNKKINFILSNNQLLKNKGINVANIKTIHKSKTEFYNINPKNNFNLKKIKSLYNIKYEYEKLLSYKKKKIKNQQKYNDEIKEKYFIRGLALNEEFGFYYNLCKRVDFYDKDEQRNTNKNKIIQNDNKNKSIKKNALNFEDNNKRNRFKHLFSSKKNGIMINYSLKNIINNKFPLSILTE